MYASQRANPPSTVQHVCDCLRGSACGVRCNTGGHIIEWWGRRNDGTDGCGGGDVRGDQRTANVPNRGGGLCGRRNELSESHRAEFGGLPHLHV